MELNTSILNDEIYVNLIKETIHETQEEYKHDARGWPADALLDRCQLTITWVSIIKDVPCKLALIWLGDTGHIGIHGGVDGRRTYGCTVPKKTKISRIDGLPYFLNYGAARARASGVRGAPLK